jgi:ParB family chromosome partitioning protein
MSKKRGLGRSLDALLVGSMSVEETVPGKDKLLQLPIDQIQRGKYQPRREMDSEALEDLAHSIRAQGVIQPIVVRPIAGNRYEIVAGERRWRASQLAGLTDIPALVKDIPDQAAVAIALIENIQRESLNPIEEGLALQRLLDEFGMTHQQVADAVGKSRASVTNMLRLLTLIPEVKKMLEGRQLEMGHARALLTLPEDLQIDVAKTILAQGLSVRDTEALVRRVQSPRLSTPAKPLDPDLNRLQQTLSNQINLPVTIRASAKGKGRLIIHYKKLAELNNILSYFKEVETE